MLVEFRNPVVIITKNELVTRDMDLLSELARFDAVLVFVSVTSLDGELARDLEPRASQPARRPATIETLSVAGIPVGVLVAPVIPGLTDHEMPSILAAVRRDFWFQFFNLDFEFEGLFCNDGFQLMFSYWKLPGFNP